jgi:hypothetical protein
MSRRTRRPAVRRAGGNSRRPLRPEPDQAAEPRRAPARPNKWFLAVALLAETAWIGFLVLMALLG